MFHPRLAAPRLTRAVVGLAALALLLGPSSAEAASGLYLQLGLGYGAFSGSELVTEETASPNGNIPDYPDQDPDTCCPAPGLATNLRLGFSLFGFGGPEFGMVADGWDLGSDTGGAGFIGGGIRLFPIKFLGLLGLDDRDFPLDAGLGVMFGYSVVGKDFAYTGTFWDVDFHIDYKLASFLSIGAKLDVVLPTYDDFALTSYKNDRGRCLDDGGAQIIDPANPNPIDRSSASCSGRGPKTTFISPSIVFTFHFDPLDPFIPDSDAE